MNPQPQGQWMLRLVTALLCTLAAASVVYWGSRLAGRGAAAAAVPVAQQRVAADDAPARQAAVARLLGASPAAAAGPAAGAAQRFALLGVIASMTGKGAALISVDGEPARPLTVGAQIAPGYVLEAVGQREAVLANRAQPIVLSLPTPEAIAAAAQPPAEASAAALATLVSVASVAKPLAASAAAAVPAPATRSPPARQDSRYR